MFTIVQKALMAGMKTQVSKQGGFTLLEIVAVLVIIGLIAVVALAAAMEKSQVDIITQTEKIKVHLRYAQSRSMNSDKAYGIRFSGGSYQMFRDGDAGTPLMLPGENSTTVTLPEGVSSEDAVVSFDSWGRPCTDAAGTERQEGERTLAAGSGITIHENTGYIQ